jgi:hypothetical protein
MKELLRKTKVILTVPILLVGFGIKELGDKMFEWGDDVIDYWEELNR